MISFAEAAGTHRAPGELVKEMEEMFSIKAGEEEKLREQEIRSFVSLGTLAH